MTKIHSGIRSFFRIVERILEVREALMTEDDTDFLEFDEGYVQSSKEPGIRPFTTLGSEVSKGNLNIS